MNVSLPVGAHILSLMHSLIDRSDVGAMLSTAKKSYHPWGSALENHRHTHYLL